jgi:phenylalanyl-tRNA synthetase alpha chain
VLRTHASSGIPAVLREATGPVRALLVEVMVEALFGPDHPWWLNRGHYPFTTPGFAVEVACPRCTGGCGECHRRGRVEIGSGGLLAREVLAACGCPDDLTGVSFGCSVERLLRLSHGVTDIRSLLGGDAGFLAQFD